ncbi:MAG: hypothetical protein LBR34_11330 [Prevotella sp.]|nr:hypothetical protein [Prevotella sp.]
MKYNVDGGADATASLTGTTYTISGISAGTSLKIRNANTTNTQLRITSIEVTYTPPACTDPELSFSTTGTIYKEADAANFTNAASSSSTGTITYSSSKPSVATVNSSTGEVTIAGEGITVITAAQDPDLAYCADETSYTLVVGEEFQPVTQNSQLIADGEYIIVGKNTTTNAYYALGYQKYSTGQIPAPTNREAAAVDVSELIPVAQTASSEADGCAYKLKLGGSTGAWTIKDIANDAYIGPASGDASDNHLKISTSETVPTWTIVVAGDSKVTITCVGAQANTNGSGRNTILFNQSNNPALFACYASTTSITPGDLYLYATPETIDNAPSSIAPVKATDAVVSSKYYNLQGQEIGTPQSGAMYIVRKVHASGKVSAAKELKR